jgi:hypothetical protein
MEKYFVIGLFILVGVVVAVISLMSRKKSENQENQPTNRPTTHQKNEQPQAIHYPQRFFMGKYLGGFPNVSVVCEVTYCSIDGDTCKVTSGMRGVECTSIHLSKINKITVEDKFLIAQKLNDIDKSALDKIITPGTKQNKYYCLAIDWDDKDGTRQYSFFEFAGSEKKNLATDAANALKSCLSREETSGERLQPQTT